MTDSPLPLGEVGWSPDYQSRGIHTRPFNGKTNDWITPKWLIDALGPFDLDPCASTRQPWPCAKRSYMGWRQNGRILRVPGIYIADWETTP